ncbi:MAG: lipopolysaccharide heptosyltransferase II [Chthoniobacterales bacterium]
MDRLIYLITAAVFSILRLLPLIVCFRMGEFFGFMAWLILPRYRKLSQQNLHAALGKELTGGEIKKLVRKNFTTLGANIFCSIKIPAMSEQAVRELFKFEGEEYWDACIKNNNGRGTVVALSHFGNWELNAQISTFILPRRSGTIYQPLRNKAVDDLINRDRRTRGVMTFDRKRGLTAAATLLSEGGVVGILIDQHAGDAGIWMPFLNKLASTSPLAATLAQKTGATLLQLTIHTTSPARWTIRVNPPIATEGREIASITYELGEELAEEIRRSPADWFWMHNRWKLPKPAFLLTRVKRGLFLPKKTGSNDLHSLKLLVRSPNWLGDACMAAPAIRSLKYGRPDLHLTIMTQKKLAPLWKALPEVDEVIELPPNTSPWKVAKFLKSLAPLPGLPPFDAALLLPNSLRSALEVWLAGIPRRIGRVAEKGKSRAFFINQPFLETKKSDVIVHEAEEYQDVAHWLGGTVEVGNLSKKEEQKLKIGTSTPSDNVNCAEALQARPLRIGICAGAEYGPAKRWPIDRFRKVMDQLSVMHEITWVVVGIKAEEPLVTSLLQGFHGTVENYVGKTDLTELIDLVQNLDLLISNDTGTMHLADLFNISTVAIFGSTEPALTGPRGAGHEILRHRVECSPCFLRSCPIDFPCMHGITPEDAVQAVMKILERRGKVE